MSNRSPLSRRLSPWWSWSLLVAPLAVVATAAGCSSSSATPNYDSGVGGPVPGMADNHCVGKEPIVVSAASCHPDAGVSESDGATADDAGADDGGAQEEPAPTRLGSESDDDDCKYHVKFMMTAAKSGQTSTFQVTVTSLVDGKPETGADVSAEGYLENNDTHVLPYINSKTSENPAGSGVYTLPVKFDADGRWVVRFHMYERCSDSLEDSPHSHVAFLVNVEP